VIVENLSLIPSPPQGVWYLGPIPIRAYALCIITGGVGVVGGAWARGRGGGGAATPKW